VVGLCACTRALSAQLAGAALTPAPGSETELAIRLAQLRGTAPDAGYLLRSLATQLPALAARRDTLVWLLPEIATNYHSSHPWGGNDGPLRAGRGANVLLTGGVAARLGRFTFVLAPQLAHEDNLHIQSIPYPQPSPAERNVWANPFYPLPTSLDYPQRFGDRPRTLISAQARIGIDATKWLRTGIAHENRWWGPAVRNGLLLTANAPPFAHVFVESPAPIVTRAGEFEYQMLLGRLRRSEFFSPSGSDNERALSAFALTWRAPRALGDWPTVGIARAVMGTNAPGLDDILMFGHDVGRPWTRPAEAARGRDQILLVFSRWLFPAVGAEAYLEWARYEQMASLRDFLESPGHTQGFTLGAQWARPFRSGTLHLQSEWSYMEPSGSIRVRPVGTSYTSPSVPEGWTHQGQMLGPAIGPGGSAQWAAADLRFDRQRYGLSLGRVRRDPNYRALNTIPPKRDDVSLFASLRFGTRIGAVDAMIEFTDAVRLNYLYQAYPDVDSPAGRSDGIDLVNRSLSLTLTPRLPR